MPKQINAEYARKCAVAADMADAAWLRGGLDAMHEDLRSLLRIDADPVVIAEVERLYHNKIISTTPHQEQ